LVATCTEGAHCLSQVKFVEPKAKFVDDFLINYPSIWIQSSFLWRSPRVSIIHFIILYNNIFCLIISQPSDDILNFIFYFPSVLFSDIYIYIYDYVEYYIRLRWSLAPQQLLTGALVTRMCALCNKLLVYLKFLARSLSFLITHKKKIKLNKLKSIVD
jgi:hypothetical protein